MACGSRWESEIVGYFSVDEHRNYVPDSSTLLYYIPQKTEAVHLDLNEGSEIAVPLPASAAHERLDYLLKWIKLNRGKIEAPVESGKWIQPSFVLPAGLFGRILSTPFVPKDNWAIFAAKWKDTIYVYVDKTHSLQTGPFVSLSEDLAAKYFNWGYKFEQFMVSGNPREVPDTSKTLFHAKEFRCVYQGRLGNHTILFDNVMKGVCSEKRLTDPLPLDELKFVETRTSIIVESCGQETTLRKYKFLKWWSRAFITNIENVVCGFRDDNGIVRELKTYTLDEMEEMSKPFWNPSPCLHFTETFLTQIAKSVVDDCDKTIYRFERPPSNGFTFEQTIIGMKLSPSAENNVLPTWYMQETETQ